MSTAFPYELLVRITKQRTIGGAMVRMLIVDDAGREREGELIPLADATDPLFVEFAEQFSAQAIAERDAIAARNVELTEQLAKSQADAEQLGKDLAQITAQRDELLDKVSELDNELNAIASDHLSITEQLAAATAAIAALTADRDNLQADLDALRNPPEPAADFDQFWAGMLAEPAFRRICGAPENMATAMALIFFFGQFASDQQRYAPKIAACWNSMETLCPLTEEEIERINELCESTGVPLRLNPSGSIG